MSLPPAPRRSRPFAWIGVLAPVGALLCVSLTVGCAGDGQRRADVVPAGESIHYATGYPERVEGTQQRIADQKLTAELMIEAIPTFPNELSDPDWGKVQYITEQADADGRGEAFAERASELRVIERFVDAHAESFSRDLGRDVDRAVEKEFGESDFRTRRSIERGMDDAVQEHRLEQLEEVSSALQSVTYWREELGDGNADALRDQVLSIALTGYIVHAELAHLRNELEDELSQAAAAKKTLEDELVVVNAFADAPDQSSSQREYNQARKTEIEAALARIDGDVAAGKETMKTLDKEIDDLQNAYDDAVTSLLADLERRALDEGAAAADADAG